MDIRVFKHGLGVKKAFEADYKYKDTDKQWQFAFGTIDSDVVSYGSETATLVTRDVLVAKQTNLVRQIVWGNKDLQSELDQVTAFLKEIN
jgi:hypothetical protein